MSSNIVRSLAVLVLTLAMLVGLSGVALAAQKTLQGSDDAQWGGGPIYLEFRSVVDYAAYLADVGQGGNDGKLRTYSGGASGEIKLKGQWAVSDMDVYWVVPDRACWTTDAYNAYYSYWVQSDDEALENYGPNELVVAWDTFPSTTMYQDAWAWWGGASSPQLEAHNSAYLG